ncbi:uncharacterized protein LOC6573259 [Drosophila mojavensis]|uniref:Protein TsetseEP domain-containing protein n=1 Tax=Drosophila mojavensis TaxID=7230 RepID=B4KCI8_DROMO|nr:uncharacterized protein LOC6573259 [Drosophila mojavensis]EDW14807.1 uncharacterized protein Dmoj_GI24462 [Drosophila mojavensis]
MSSTGSLVVLLGLAVMAAARLQIPKIQSLQHQAEVLSVQNPSNGPACFSFYRPMLDSIAEQYEAQYNLCNSQYEDQAVIEYAKWQQPREQLTSRGRNSCGRIDNCASIVSAVQAFECYAEVGSDESKTMYGISANAIEMLTDMEALYQKLISAKDICINNAERTYVEFTATVYEALNDCLSGKIILTSTPKYDITTTPDPDPTATTDEGYTFP